MSSPTARTARLPRVVRPYWRADRSHVEGLLSFLPTLYPRGDEWLSSRLLDVESGHATCWVATVRGLVAGVAIETPKGASRLKLSTFFVGTHWRRRSVGSTMLDDLVRSWIRRDVASVCVTVAAERDNDLRPLLLSRGFGPVAVVPALYGETRDELVYEWRA
jgi:hypothetical protein